MASPPFPFSITSRAVIRLGLTTNVVKSDAHISPFVAPCLPVSFLSLRAGRHSAIGSAIFPSLRRKIDDQCVWGIERKEEEMLTVIAAEVPTGRKHPAG